MVIVSKLRIHKVTGQKTITVPKQKETNNWVEGDLIEVKKVIIK